jgi:hypothetical protein
MLSILLLLSASCSHDATPTLHKGEKEASSAPPQAGDWIRIKTPNDSQVAQFKVEGANTAIEYAGSRLQGEQKESGKRKYQDQSGTVLVEVKADGDDFKVRTPDGRLLWKVKVSPDKIKIANNEEMTAPFAIEPKERERLKVYRNEQEIGRVKFNAERGKAKVENASNQVLFDSNSTRLSAMYGVLLMTDIPDRERFVIMAELLARGR